MQENTITFLGLTLSQLGKYGIILSVLLFILVLSINFYLVIQLIKKNMIEIQKNENIKQKNENIKQKNKNEINNIMLDSTLEQLTSTLLGNIIFKSYIYIFILLIISLGLYFIF